MAHIRDLTTRMRGRRVRGGFPVGEPRTHWRPRSGQAWKHARRSRLRSRLSAAELRLVLLAGAMAGLVLADAGFPWAGVPANSPLIADGWASDVRVVDGDTFWAGGVKVRIADIDTPEIRARCDAEAVLAARATSRLGQLLAAGPFTMEPLAGRDEDRYGRKLRVVTRNGRSLGDQLVAEGLARTWTGHREPWCQARARIRNPVSEP